MSLKRGACCLALLLLPVGCLPDAALDTDAQKASYGKGLEAARSMENLGDSLDLAAFLAGLTDGLDDAEPAVAAEEIEAALARLAGDAAPPPESDEAPEGESEGEGEDEDAGAPSDPPDR